MIKRVTKETARNIIKNRMPFGGFWLKKKDKFIGIENQSGDAQVEVFKNKKACLRWLKK